MQRTRPVHAGRRRLEGLLLDLAGSVELAPILRAAVLGLLGEAGTALARVWLLDPAETPCLRLAASAGRPRAERADWTRIDGSFSRFPVGVGKIGRVAATAAPLALRDVQAAGRPRLARPGWARREGIRGFAALPLLHGGRVLGVLGVFQRATLADEGLEQLRGVAAHTAAGVARASAFGALALRAEGLARENERLRETLALRPAFEAADAPQRVLRDAEVQRLLRDNVARALQASGGRIYGSGGAAERLGLRPTTLASRLRKLRLASGEAGA
jgi:GAF domain-containing protein